MIVRVWRGHAAPASRAAYPAHFRGKVLPALRQLAGFRGATLLERDDGDQVEFVVLTRWESLDAIRAFAGDDVAQAIVEPEAVAALVSFDRMALHYAVAAETGTV